ncbi:hypothetical protein HMPREF9946_01590 [Acetobacteraceae bacterium AT-5844]|nr:hypothetical protein HMPREF9946_01590 [Acetobacteraceae bacterium AT-5844]
MQPSRSIATTTMVALMAAHRMVQERPSGAPAPLDPRLVRRIMDRLWKTEAAARTESRAPRPA